VRIHRIEARNFLSFDEFVWEGVSPGLNVLIGPNGGGKSNLLLAFRAMRDALSFQPTAALSDLQHHRKRGRATRLSVDLTFDGRWEQAVLSAFVAAAFCDEQALTSANDQQLMEPALTERLSDWLVQECTPDQLQGLFHGRLVVGFDGRDSRWIYYHSLDDRTPYFFLDITGPGNDSTLYGSLESQTARRTETTARAWLAALDGEEAQQRWREYFAGKGNEPPPQFDPFSISARATCGINLNVRRPQRTQLPTHRQFANLLEMELDDSSRYYNAWFLFERLLSHGLVLSDNVHEFPREEVTAEQLVDSSPIDIATGRDLGLHLFRLKNRGGRDAFERIQRTFSDVTFGCSFDVQTVQLPKSDDTHSGIGLRIFIGNGAGPEVPLRYAGAGRWEALFCSTLIESGADRVLLLDEPATHTHAPVQERIIERLRRIPNQVFIATHAPSLLPVDELERVSRFQLKGGATVRAALDGLDAKTLSQLKKELRQSLGARVMLMSRHVILTEGGTELGALPIWFANRRKGEWEHADLSIFSVDGDPRFGFFVRYLNALDVRWTIVCDGPVIGPCAGRAQYIDYQLVSAGIEDVPDLSSMDFSHRVDALERCGVFTVAKQATDEFEDAVPVLREWSRDRTRHKPRIGYECAVENPDCPDEIARLQDRIATHFAALDA